MTEGSKDIRVFAYEGPVSRGRMGSFNLAYFRWAPGKKNKKNNASTRGRYKVGKSVRVCCSAEECVHVLGNY